MPGTALESRREAARASIKLAETAAKKPPRAAGKGVGNGEAANPIPAEWVAQAAYFHAEKRGFAPGGELEDWLAAEHEIKRAMASLPRTPA